MHSGSKLLEDPELLNAQKNRLEAEATVERLLKDISVGRDSKEKLINFSICCNLMTGLGKDLQYLIGRVGKLPTTAILQSMLELDLLELSDAAIQEIFAMLIRVLVNSFVDECRQLIGLVFSTKVWLRLSKFYLRNLLSTYPKFINEFKEVKAKQLTKSEEAGSRFLEKVLTLFGHKYSSLSFNITKNEVRTCEKLLEFLVVCLSNTSSRLPALMIMQDKEFIVKNSLFFGFLKSKYSQDKETLLLDTIASLLAVLKRFVTFDILGESRVAKANLLVHYDTFQEFQRLLYHYFAQKVEPYVVKSVGSADTREKLAEIFSYLEEEDLKLLAQKLNLFIPDHDQSDPVLSILTDKEGYKLIIEEILIGRLKARKSMLERIKETPVFPTEAEIWKAPSKLTNRDYHDSVDYRESYALDRVTYTFINLEDYLIRHYYLWRQAFSLEIKKLVEDTVQLIHPVFERHTGIVKEFNGWSTQTVEVKEFTVFEVDKPRVGETIPRRILAEVKYSTVEMNSKCRAEWETLKSHDSLFLLSLNKKAVDDIVNELADPDLPDFISSSGIIQMRGCDLVSHLDEERNKINTTEFRKKNDISKKGYTRYLQVHLEPNQYSKDLTSLGKAAPDRGFSVALKRNEHCQNYPTYLKLIVKLLERGVELPDWVTQMIVGKQPVADSMEEESLDAADLDRYLPQVREAIQAGLSSKLNLVVGGPGTGKSLVCAEIAQRTLKRYPNKKVLIVTNSEWAIGELITKLIDLGVVPMDEVIRLGDGDGEQHTREDFSRFGRVNWMLRKRLELLEAAKEVALDIGIDLYTGLTCETAEILFKSQIAPRWKAWVDEGLNSSQPFPFEKYFQVRSPDQLAAARTAPDQQARLQAYTALYDRVKAIFDQLSKTKFLELLRYTKERANYLLNYYCSIVLTTASFLILKHEELFQSKCEVETVLFDEAGQIPDFEAVACLSICKGIKRISLVGDIAHYPPNAQHSVIDKIANLELTLFHRLVRLGFPKSTLTSQSRSRPDISKLFRAFYPDLLDAPAVAQSEELAALPPGLKHPVQFIDVCAVENSPFRGFYQNLDEAEYAVAIFSYLVLNGVAPAKISILVSSQGQDILIREIVEKKTGWHKKLGSPGWIGLVDKYQGQHNDYVILSLVRTSSVGGYNQENKIAVALGRARLGMYLLGNARTFKAAKEFNRVFEALDDKSLTLQLRGQTPEACSDYVQLLKVCQSLVK